MMGLGSDDFPLQNGWVFRFQPLIFRGVPFVPWMRNLGSPGEDLVVPMGRTGR